MKRPTAEPGTKQREAGCGGVPEAVRRLLPPKIRKALESCSPEVLEALEEIRIRRDLPVHLWTGRGEGFLMGEGRLSPFPAEGMVAGAEDVMHVVQGLSQSSLYALEEELRRGYVTLPGGHRAGIVGRAVVAEGRVQTQVDITGVNLRVARPVTGISRDLADWLVEPPGKIGSVLIISPPQCGKTTLLRDLAYQVSSGRWHPLVAPRKVAVVDERSELAGTWKGRRHFDLGPRTDVLDGCPKAEGMMILLRSMSPEILVTDEIGGEEDVAALREVLRAGVIVFASVHGGDLQDIRRRPSLRPLVEEGAFFRYVVLSRQRGPMTVEGIFDASGRRLRAQPGRQPVASGG
ncbi:MAG: stage III sporulation protein AA [Alicyclobacillaceae bacterium]|nr:stage III sporulation protein AA [Alicyclobacillaceae bacterium]